MSAGNWPWVPTRIVSALNCLCLWSPERALGLCTLLSTCPDVPTAGGHRYLTLLYHGHYHTLEFSCGLLLLQLPHKNLKCPQKQTPRRLPVQLKSLSTHTHSQLSLILRAACEHKPALITVGREQENGKDQSPGPFPHTLYYWAIFLPLAQTRTYAVCLWHGFALHTGWPRIPYIAQAGSLLLVLLLPWPSE